MKWYRWPALLTGCCLLALDRAWIGGPRALGGGTHPHRSRVLGSRRGASFTACKQGPKDDPVAAGNASQVSSSASRRVMRTLRGSMVKKLREASQTGEANRAAKLFSEYERYGGKLSTNHFNLVMAAAARKGQTKIVETWFKRLQSSGCEVDAVAYNTVITCHARRGSLEGARSWLQQMCAGDVQPDVLTFRKLITAAGKSAGSKTAELWLNKMVDYAVSPDRTCYTNLLIACLDRGVRGDFQLLKKTLQRMRAEEVELDVNIYRIIVNAAAKAGEFKQARHWLQEMADSKLRLNAQELARLFSEYEEYGGVMDASHFNLVIQAAAREGEINQVEAWLRRLEKGGAVDADTYKATIKLYAMRGRLTLAKKYMQRMRDNGLQPDTEIYRIVIAAASRVRDVKKSQSKELFFREMCDAGMQPDTRICNTMLAGYLAKNRTDEALEWFQEISDAGVKPDTSIYNTMLAAYLANNRTDEATLFLSYMERTMVSCDQLTFRSMISHFASRDALREAELWMNKMVQAGFAASNIEYQVLLDSYARAGREGQAAQILERMTQQRLEASEVTSSTAAALLAGQNAKRSTTAADRPE
eukprot:TRINITY_DN111495_c0_g1_i1.p1 TRINITY_DN111495_c0_g1~~TRINITY_DN111495_c0_g1_i1.p1  ORF type:complete len:588 (+),score=87.92 TRINITY_DN111495_c0_g1_i1:221-1984(+)